MRPPCSGIAHDHNICIRIQIPTRFSQTHAAHHVGRADRDSFRGAPRLHACRSRRVRGRIAAMGAACATGDRADVTPLARGGTAPRQRFRRRGATPSDAD
ncbi:hypothetical protein DM56_4461 [Burkholderia mallei]|nr:hypothetical protein DM75_3338 [Burkholderia mallei]KOS76062.1 hypothetical protein DM46_1943 [Burkholderia mallei]KOS93084.1 hypothetical protein DM45_3092 [Burkholderia mallei]KOS96927.1 hypothetical protein DM49_3051 [Burkholderia mallei]KOT00877.1 hypothetical protein DM50_3182 [Burkholderia mallei]